MGRGSTVALAAAAALLVSLPMLLLVPQRPADPYEQETRRMFVEWKARVNETYKHAGEEECRYAVFKDTRRDVARDKTAGDTTSGLNGFAATTDEEFSLRLMFRGEAEGAYEQEIRLMFGRWKAKYRKTYRDVGEEECRYWLFKGNRRVVVRLNTAGAAAGRNAYGLNQFGDLTNEEVRERCGYPKIIEDRELSVRCQADPDSGYGKMIRYQVCRCIAMELKETESRGALWTLEDLGRHGVRYEGAIIPDGDHLQDHDADQDMVPFPEDQRRMR